MAIEANILDLLVGLLQAKVLDLSTCLVEGCSAIVISWLCLLERDPWKYSMWVHQILDLASSLGCSFSWSPHSTIMIADCLAKCAAKQMVSFVRDFLLLELYTVAYFVHVFVSY